MSLGRLARGIRSDTNGQGPFLRREGQGEGHGRGRIAGRKVALDREGLQAKLDGGHGRHGPTHGHVRFHSDREPRLTCEDRRDRAMAGGSAPRRLACRWGLRLDVGRCGGPLGCELARYFFCQEVPSLYVTFSTSARTDAVRSGTNAPTWTAAWSPDATISGDTRLNGNVWSSLPVASR